MYGLSDEMFGGYQKKENYKLKNGEHKLRILPPYAPNKLYAFVRLHWYSNDQGQGRIPVRCLAPKKKGAEELCPACAKVAQMKGEAANLIATGNHAAGKELEEAAGNMAAKATYLWQILDNEGQHKLLSLSYRAHESLTQVVGFWWKQKQINITDPERNYKLYCNRTGQKAQTNYAWAVLDTPQDIRKIDVPELWDLDAHHEMKTLEEIQEIVRLGYVPSKKKDGAASLPTDQAAPANSPATPPVDNTGIQESAQAAAAPENAAPETTHTPSQQTPGLGGVPNFTADDIPF